MYDPFWFCLTFININDLIKKRAAQSYNKNRRKKNKSDFAYNINMKLPALNTPIVGTYTQLRKSALVRQLYATGFVCHLIRERKQPDLPASN